MKYLLILLMLFINCSTPTNAPKSNNYATLIYEVDGGKYLDIIKYNIDGRYYLIFVGPSKIHVIELDS